MKEDASGGVVSSSERHLCENFNASCLNLFDLATFQGLATKHNVDSDASLYVGSSWESLLHDERMVQV